MHSLVKTPSHEKKRMPAEQVRQRTRIASLEKPAFVLQDQPVDFRVGGENGWFTKDVGCKNTTKLRNPVIYERFGVFSLVGGDELQGFSEQRETKVPRRQTSPPAGGGAIEEESEKGDGKKVEKVEEEDGHGVGAHNFVMIRGVEKSHV